MSELSIEAKIENLEKVLGFVAEKLDVANSEDLEKRKIGGLGIYMVKKMMDAVEYRREGDKNILTVRKKFFSTF